MSRRCTDVLRGAAVVAALVLAACSANTAKNRYVLAEKLWNDRNYAAAVTEFEKVYARDPRGKLGLQALFRAAMTEYLFLSRYGDAISKFETYAQLSPGDPAAWEAQKHIGEIYFTKTEQYDDAIRHYRGLLAQKPAAEEAPEFLYRIGRAAFFTSQFDQALDTYGELLTLHPASSWAEKAMYQIGVTYFTRGEQGASTGAQQPFQKAIAAFEAFMKKFPKSQLVPEAKFGVASCLEELDQLDAAYQAYEALLGTYPSPKVIQIKLARIRQRKAQRSR